MKTQYQNKLGTLAFLLGLGGAVFSCGSVPDSKPLEPLPQDNHTGLEFCLEEQSPCQSSSLIDCPLHDSGTETHEDEKTMEDFVDEIYKEMTSTKTKRMYVRNTIKRINKFDKLFETYSQRYDVEKNLMKAIAYVESRGRHKDESGKITTSYAGALGFMQLMPDTAEWLKVDPHVLWQNIKGGIKQLGINLKHYNGDIVPAITAYNAGIRTTDYLTKKAESDNFLDYRESTNNEEIKGYTLKVLAAKKIFDN